MKAFEVKKDKRFLLARMGAVSQIAGLKRYEFSEGKAKGVEAVDVRTGSGLEFTVLPGRGMDIAWTSYRGVPLAYMAKPGIVAPGYYEHDGANWLRSFFGGMLTTCGLTNVGTPSEWQDQMLGRVELGQHGRISNMAADQVCVKEEWHGDELRMGVSGRLREAMLHAESLTLTREISATLGGDSILLVDTIENEGALPRPLMILYHINAGYPLLDAGSRLLCNPKSIECRDEEAAKGAAEFREVHGPANAYRQKVYFHDLPEDGSGDAWVALVNDRLEVGLYVRFGKKQLPEFTQWKQLGESDYVMGLEPGNARPQGLAEQRKRGKLETLAPGAKKRVELEIGVLPDADAISRFERFLGDLR